MADLVQIATTVGSEDAARRLAEALVNERLAACVQVTGPVDSTYRWRGALERSREWLCVAKTTRHRSGAATRRIGELHEYEQPEILVTPVLEADPGYAAWVAAETTPG